MLASEPGENGAWSFVLASKLCEKVVWSFMLASKLGEKGYMVIHVSQ